MNAVCFEAVPRGSVPAAAAATSQQGSELDRLIAEHAVARDMIDAPGGDTDAEAERFLATVRALDDYVPQTSAEFVRSLAARFSDDEPPTEEAVTGFIRIARQLTFKDR